MIEAGRVAIVTGGGRGIGREIAQRLGREGADVAISYRSNDAAAEEAAEAVREAGEDGTLTRMLREFKRKDVEGRTAAEVLS